MRVLVPSLPSIDSVRQGKSILSRAVHGRRVMKLLILSRRGGFVCCSLDRSRRRDLSARSRILFHSGLEAEIAANPPPLVRRWVPAYLILHGLRARDSTSKYCRRL